MTRKKSNTFLRNARQRLGLSQIGFAAKLGISRASIARYEGGYPMPEAIRLAILRLRDEHNRRKAIMRFPPEPKIKVLPLVREDGGKTWQVTRNDEVIAVYSTRKEAREAAQRERAKP
jgi:transcriptional regulator with XRE-family HTH domain